MPPNYKMVPSSAEEPRCDLQRYRKTIGQLLFVSTCTTPDIAHAVSSPARVTDSASKEHERILMYLLRYLAESKDKALHFDCQDAAVLICFVDASFASHETDVPT
eukprot:m.21532 g.21532  ORF g.21532 m.21532 type:complete len:105 (+) comp8296_c0_seq1:79-393(+)